MLDSGPPEVYVYAMGMAARLQPIDRPRYRKVRRFALGVVLHALWWDVLLGRGGLSWLRSLGGPPAGRWLAIARRYRLLAVEMGGLLIKLGQFLGTRVDLLPPEVIAELAGLQDEVPPVSFDSIVAQVEQDFGRPWREVFAELSPRPVGSASLAQVYAARLPSGEAVVAKVLRPGISVLMETDLAAIRLAFRWLSSARRLRRRVDLDRLQEEFDGTTRRELDLQAEGRNAEQFARDFAGDPQVRIPRVYWAQTAARILTLENVAALKVTDPAALAAAGIDSAAVAAKLYDIYLQQILVHNFVHADPHPGNLFIQPLPPAGTDAPGSSRPFQIVLVDFGMVATVPPRLRAALRTYILALGRRDAHGMVEAYVSAGLLLPGADLKRIEEAFAAVFDRFWGVSMGQMKDTALRHADYFFREFRDIIYSSPFQFPADLLFVLRAIGLLAGTATTLSADFDPWAPVESFARRLAADELKKDWRGHLADLAQRWQQAAGLPDQLGRVLNLAQRGQLEVRVVASPEVRRQITSLDGALRRLGWWLLSVAFLMAWLQVHLQKPQPLLEAVFLAAGGVCFLCGARFRR